jgi:hypothetical protein
VCHGLAPASGCFLEDFGVNRCAATALGGHGPGEFS